MTQQHRWNRRVSVRRARLAVAVILPALALGLGLSGSRTTPPSGAATIGTEAPSAPVLLDAFLTHPVDPADRDSALVLLRAAVTAREAGDSDSARRRFEAAAGVLPAFSDWARLLAADAAARGGDTSAVRRLLASTGPDMARDRGWRAQVRAFRAARDRAGAARAAAAAQPVPAGERADAGVTLGELRLQLSDTAGARAALRLAVDSFPGSWRSVDAARALGSLRGMPLEDRRRIGLVYMRHGNMPRALQNLDAWLEGRGGTADERNALRLEIGRALFRARDNRLAARRMLALASLQVKPEVAAEALLLAGRSQYRDGRESDARVTLERAVERAGGSGAIAAEALFVLGDMAHDDGRLDSARELYRRARVADPASARGHEAAVRYGALAYLRGDMAAAAAAFTDTVASGERRQRLDYWAALSSVALGDSARAHALLRGIMNFNPLTYYGMRAAERLAAPAPRPPAGPTDTELTATRVRTALLRYDLLRALELNDASSYELDRVQREYRSHPEVVYALAEALHERGEHLRAILIGRELERAAAERDARMLRIINPFPYRELIVREARRNGLDPYFVAALIRQESLFNPEAKSGAGAIGLMQVMPRTGKAVARQLGIRNFSAARLTDPGINVRIGTVILAEHLRTYGGRVPDVLVAYNAGAGRLSRWRSLPERREPELFVERIPYDETRDYVRIVQTNAYLYRSLYGD